MKSKEQNTSALPEKNDNTQKKPESTNNSVSNKPDTQKSKNIKRPDRSTSKSFVLRGRIAAGILLVCLFSLVLRLVKLQITEGEDTRNAAVNQYTYEINIKANRGTVYDRNMKQLARSSTVQTVFISPKDMQSLSDSAKADIVDTLSGVLSVSKTEILEKCKNTGSMYQIIKRQIEEAEELELRDYVARTGYHNIICFEEDTKRYYPYSELASQVIGFIGAENKGLNGIELTYNNLLSGIDGKAVKGKDGMGNELPFNYETYIDKVDGQDIVLTIDRNIQSIMEKYIKQGYEEHKPTYGIRAIMLEVDTGEILGMVSYEGYDLNNRNTLVGSYLERYNAFEGTEEEKKAYEYTLLQEMWKNKTATELYDPGSTFKIITTAMGLEEGVFTADTHYNCAGSYLVAGTPIKCHSGKVHGSQTVTEALVNSCNPAYVQMGLAIGHTAFEKYFYEFGYTEKTGSDVLGEANSIYYKDLSNPADLARNAFGQSMSVTALQHIRAVNAIANGGYLVTPHLLKATVDKNGTVVSSTAYDEKKQVISETTANTVLQMLVNSTKNASVSGYNISSKTGTSQKLGRPGAEEGKEYYISSCVSFAPAEDPQIAILVIVDEPTGSVYYGSQVAAPIIGNILGEVLPYLDIPMNDEEVVRSFTVPEYRGSTAEQAKYSIENLKNNNITCIVRGNGDTVVEQMPRVGTQIQDGGVIILYTEEDMTKKTVSLRRFDGMTAADVQAWCTRNNINLVMEGIFNKEFTGCHAVSQSAPAGTEIEAGSTITVSFIYEEEIQ